MKKGTLTLKQMEALYRLAKQWEDKPKWGLRWKFPFIYKYYTIWI